MLLVPAYDPLEQPVGRCAKWTLKRVPGLGAWKWVKHTDNGPEDRDHDDDFKAPNDFKAPDTVARPPQVPTFDRATFDHRLRSDGWSFEESTYLVDLCSRFEQRFVVVADRYTYSRRSMLEIKRRYHEIVGRLNSTTPHPLDVDAEKKRRVAEELFASRPKEQVVEEQQLLGMARSVQANLQALWKRRQEMIATVAGDTFLMNAPGLPDILGLTTEQVLQDYQDALEDSVVPPQPVRDKKKKKIRRAIPSEASAKHQQSASSSSAITPMLRSACLKPIKAGLARQVDKYMATDLNLPLRPSYPSERNCTLYDQIRAAVADMIEQSKKSAK